MDYKYINQLLERYWACETSMEEEAILRTFFSQEEIPADLMRYKSLFAYEQREASEQVLGDDFDSKMLQLIATDDTAEPKKAKVISLSERLKPLFKAAAIVAIFLTLGNAAQVPFQDNGGEAIGNTGATKQVKSGAVTAIADSAIVDTMQHTSIAPMTTEHSPSPTLLK